eukprot:2558672-Rhodomonas_salina.3
MARWRAICSALKAKRTGAVSKTMRMLTRNKRKDIRNRVQIHANAATPRKREKTRQRLSEPAREREHASATERTMHTRGKRHERERRLGQRESERRFGREGA